MQIFACNVQIYIWIESFFNMVSKLDLVVDRKASKARTKRVKPEQQWFHCSIVAWFCTRNGNLWFMNLALPQLNETVSTRNRLNVRSCECWAEILFYFSSFFFLSSESIISLILLLCLFRDDFPDGTRLARQITNKRLSVISQRI